MTAKIYEFDPAVMRDKRLREQYRTYEAEGVKPFEFWADIMGIMAPLQDMPIQYKYVERVRHHCKTGNLSIWMWEKKGIICPFCLCEVKDDRDML